MLPLVNESRMSVQPPSDGDRRGWLKQYRAIFILRCAPNIGRPKHYHRYLAFERNKQEMKLTASL